MSCAMNFLFIAGNLRMRPEGCCRYLTQPTTSVRTGVSESKGVQHTAQCASINGGWGMLSGSGPYFYYTFHISREIFFLCVCMNQ